MNVKKIIACVVAAASMMQPVAASESFNVVKKDTVSVIGKSNHSYENVSILVLKEGKTLDDVKNGGTDGILYVDQTKTDGSGEYSFKISRNGMPKGAKFLVYQSGGNEELINAGKILSDDEIEGKKALNVLDYGADNTGVKDNTYILTNLHNTGKMIYYPCGTYRFNGKNLDLSGGVAFEDMDNTKVVNDISDKNIIQFDDNGRLIGLMHNHLEQDDADNGYGWKMDIGNITAPPVSTANYKTKVDFIPYWYNDFGLERTRIAGGGAGWTGWYYWTWNFQNPREENMVYDSSRHPLLGHYRGDDQNVLDWQCYWLNEYGAKAVTLMTAQSIEPITDNWQNPANSNYWIYQLFNNVPNFNNLGYVLSISPAFGKMDETQLNAVWDDAIDNIIGKYGNAYCVEKNGKKYPAIFMFEEGAVHGVFNYDTSKYIDFCASKAEKLKSYGYDGLAILARNPVNDNMSGYNAVFENRDVIRYVVDYEPNSTGDTYSDMVNNFTPKGNTYNIQNAFTSAKTQYPHPSGWNHPGNTPELFATLMKKQVEYLENNSSMPKIITCYNMSEWAEGGAGMQPTVGERFGYLEAMKDAIVENPQMNINTIYYGEDNIPHSKISSRENLIQKTDIYNTCYNGETATVITAMYKGSKLVDVMYDIVELTEKKTRTERILTKEQLNGITEIKVMAFSSKDKIIPLSAINGLN